MSYLQLLLYPALAFVPLIILISIGYSLFASIQPYRLSESSTEIAQSLNIGLAIVVSTAFYFASLGFIQISKVYVGLVAIFFVIFFAKLRIRMTLRETRANLFYIFGIGTLIGFWQLIPGLLFGIRNNLNFTTVAFGNNDISYYIAMANHFRDYGFNSVTRLSNNDLAQIAEVNYFSPTVLLSFTSSILNLPVWKISMVVLILASSIACLNIFRLINILAPINTSKFNVTLLTVFTFSSALISYCYLRYFLGQIIAIGIAAGIVASSYQLIILKDRSKVTYVEFISLVVLAVYTHTHVLLLILLITLFAFYFSILRQRTFSARDFVGIRNSLFLSFFLLIPYFPSGYKLFMNTIKGENGWPMSILTPYGLLMDPGEIGPILSKMNLVSIWLVSVSVLLFMLQKVHNFNFKNPIYLLLGSLSLSGYLIWLVRGRALTEYSSWKLIAYFLPIIIVLVGSLLIQGKLYKVVLSIFVCITSLTSISQWDFTTPSQDYPYVSEEFSSAMQRINQMKLLGLNVDLPSYFETMISVSLLSDTRLFLNSESYFQKSKDETFCTLVRIDDPSKPKIKLRLGKLYGLVGDSSTCLSRSR
jgi:hypothetical protein